MWGFFSKDPTAQFQYTIGEEVGTATLAGKSVFKVYDGESKKGDQEQVSVFVCDDPEYLEAGKAAVKKLKTLKHPSILTYVDSVESDKCVMLAAERVAPLPDHLDQDLKDRGPKRDWYIAWGIFQVTRGLAFLNVDAKLRHNNINSASIFVNSAGEWKLFSLEYVVPITDEHCTVRKIMASLDKYNPPEVTKNSRISYPWSVDMWGLGCLIWEIFNGPLPAAANLGKLGTIPKALCPIYMELVASNPSKRPNPKDLISRLRKSYFKNDLIDSILFLEELQIQDESEKSRFYGNLTPKLENFPVHVCSNKILPQLINAFEFGNAGSSILGPVFKLGKNLSTEEYQSKIVPCIVKLFSSNDRNARYKLLCQLENFVEHFNEKIVNDQVFPQIVNGFVDKEPVIREKSVIAMIHLASKLNYSNLDEKVVMMNFSRLLRDEQAGIRTNTTVCLGKIARYLHYATRQKVLISAFAGKLKDPFPPARIAAINALAATQQYYTIHETSTRVLPAICSVMVDPEKPVREQAFKVAKGFIQKLEQVSEDPSLKEEMEAHVKSSEAALTSTAAAWASWAVGAIGAKFYKSANKPPPPEKPKEKQTENKEDDAVTASSAGVEKKDPVSEPSESGSGWDDDKWGEDNDDGDGESKNDDNDGWDDAEDWGSLDDDRGITATVKESSAYDWNPKASLSAKPHTGFSDLTPTNKGGNDSWNDNGSGWDDFGSTLESNKTEDEKKKQREEKRLARQREIQAKRASKGGPMKLGAKKL